MSNVFFNRTYIDNKDCIKNEYHLLKERSLLLSTTKQASLKIFNNDKIYRI